MNYCPDCGEMVIDGDPYCSHCGADLSNDDYDSQIPHERNDDYSILDDGLEDYARIQKSLQKFADHYKVELEDLDVKDTYTEYIFLRKTPYYTLRMVATDQYGNTIGLKRDSISVDLTGLRQNADFQKLTRNLDIRNIYVGLREDVIHIRTEEGTYPLDTDNMRLVRE